MNPFVHLHVHSDFSVLDGKSKIPALVDLAIADGMKGMALTDHGVMYGVKEFSDYCAKVNKSRKKEGLEPFKPILGCEMYVAHGKKEDKTKGNYHLVVLAKNYNGYKNLIKLVSRAWVDGFYYRARTDREDLAKYHEDLIVCSACIGGEIPKKILAGDIAGAEEACRWYHEVFGDDFYLELQRHEVKDPRAIANRETFQLQEEVNKVLIPMAKREGVKLICTNDVHFEKRDYAEAHDILLCIGTGADYEDPNRMRYTKEEYLKSQAEMNEVFHDVPEALSNTLEILDKVEVYSIEHGPIMPNFPIPADFGTEDDIRKKYTEEDLLKEFSSDEKGNNTLPREEGMKKIESLGGFDKVYRIKFEAEYLKKLAYDGAKRLYGDPIPEHVLEQVDFELHVMKTMGFPGYFLIVSDFIDAARKELGVIVGPGRGSAAGSTVAYCLGITRIDPLKYDLLFERFLNPDRISLPDIDVDFDDDGRGRVLNWVTQKYGADNVAHIITYGTMATKLAIKDVARVQKLPLAISNDLCKLIPDKLPEGPDGKVPKMNLTNAIAAIPELREAETSSDTLLRDTIRYAKMLEGNVRNTGVHACGFIICRDNISDWVPVSTAKDKETGEELHCTQYEGRVIEETGLIKMDFLGLKTLSIIKEAIENIKLSLGIDLNIDEISIEDPATYQLYCDGRTIGTFQFESTGMQKYLRDLQPSTFEDLIAMNALYRPGPMQYIPSFIARKHGDEPITYDLPCMEKYLKDTYGITVYQEQVMLLSREIANFTRGESDALRKAMGKKLIEKLNHMYPKFIDGGKANGYDPKVLEKIWNDWRAFASYAFNKSHATCYSWVAYQTAYLKANYPSQYMAGVMSRSLSDITTVSKLMDECKSMGISTLGPDINESYLKFSVNHSGDIRFGMGAVKGVGEGAVLQILEERKKNGLFKSVYDLVERVNLSTCNKKSLESLALSGAFDSFGTITREQFVVPDENGNTFLDALVSYGNRFQIDRAENSMSLFGPSETLEISKPEPSKQIQRWSDLERLNKERDLIGIYISGHPLDSFKIIVDNVCNMHMEQLEDVTPFANQDVSLGGIVTDVRVGQTRNGKPYGIVKMEDYSGAGEIPLFGDDWANFSGYFQVGNTLFVTGRVEERQWKENSYELKIGRVEFLADVKDQKIRSITISVDADQLSQGLITEMVSIMKKSEGPTELYFNVHDREKQQQLMLQSRSIHLSVDSELIEFLKKNEIEYNIN